MGAAFTTDHDHPGLGEQVLLWSMRAWVLGRRQDRAVIEPIRRAFAKIGAAGAACRLDQFMWILADGSHRTLHVECVCAAGMSADERSLLDIFALAQQGHSFEALLLLRSIVKPAAALSLGAIAAELAGALDSAGQRLAPAARETERYVLPCEPRTLH